MEEYLKALEPVSFRSVALGYEGITLFDGSDITEQQRGYSIGLSGEDLTGPNPGDWQREWLVIGIDEICGDPIFIDTSGDDLPVYTAMHGEGEWEPERIADSFGSFIAVLEQIRVIAAGRESPVALEENPLPEAVKEEPLEKIEALNPESSLEFWELWLDAKEDE